MPPGKMYFLIQGSPGCSCSLHFFPQFIPNTSSEYTFSAFGIIKLSEQKVKLCLQSNVFVQFS